MDDSKWYVYVLESETTGRYYYGSSVAPGRRFREHNTNHTPSTRNRGPWKLKWIRGFADKKEAGEFERWFKKTKNRVVIDRYLKEYPTEDVKLY